MDIKSKVYSNLPVALQNRLVSLYGSRILAQRFGPEYEKAMDFYETSQWWNREELRAYQDERLHVLVRHAFDTVPYYGDLMRAQGLSPDDITTQDDLSKLPALTKHDVRHNIDRLISTDADRRRLHKAYTSGSTGLPVSVYWDQGVTTINNASLWRCRRWAGFEFGRPYASLLVYAVVPERQASPPFWRLNAPWNQLLLSSLHLSVQNVPAYLDAMNERGVEALEAYPSTAYVLAQFMRELDVFLPLTCVFTTSEPLLDFQREAIEERFRCSVFDAYGQAERVMFSGECSEHRGHHVHEEYGITELVDADGEPVPTGSVGRVLATGLHNFAMPLLRYEVGDAAAFTGEPCPCGRGLRLLDGVSTKAEDILVMPDGRMVTSTAFLRAFKGIVGIDQLQVVQRATDRLTVRLVTNPEYSDRGEQTIRTRLRERFGEDVTLSFEFPESIPRTGRGKYRTVISDVPLQWGQASTANLYQGEHSE